LETILFDITRRYESHYNGAALGAWDIKFGERYSFEKCFAINKTTMTRKWEC